MIKFLENTTDTLIRGEKLVLQCISLDTHPLLKLTYSWQDYNRGKTIATGMVYRNNNTGSIYPRNTNQYKCEVTAKHSGITIRKSSDIQKITILCM